MKLAAPLLVLAVLSAGRSAGPLPHLEQRGQAIQLIVDGRPWLIRGGEVANTATSDPAYMRSVWPRLARLNLNTVLAGVAWDWIEPTEGKYDFALVDDMLAGARAAHLRLVVLWFGSWKNGLSSFAPAWVKADSARFPRARLTGGRPVEVLSSFSLANRDADARAYVALMRHLREVDAQQQTVLMIQLENEVGLLGDARDHCPAAEAAFAAPVPSALTGALGLPPADSWAQMAAPSHLTEERFMAWHYARYMDHLAELGKTEYALPVFTNTWIVQPEDHGPGDYPSGGPEPQVLEVWRAGAPHIDLNCPDIYLPNFSEWVERFHRPDRALFVPESRGDAAGVANAYYCIGQAASLGYSPFGIDDAGRLLVLRPQPGQAEPSDLEALPLAKGYAVLRQLEPLILEHQAAGTIAAASLDPAHPQRDLTMGHYVVKVDLRRNFRDPTLLPPLGYALILQMGPDEFLVAGCDAQITFAPAGGGPEIVGLAAVEAGSFDSGHWVAHRRLSGDDVLLNYHQAEAANGGQSGSGLRFGPAGPTLQRVKLYRYR